ncbi:MAG: hypothetical protein HQL91_05630 [Magnetococcales bacterium]|nr:hypothetical protein [Magnetococcales bacterium]
MSTFFSSAWVVKTTIFPAGFGIVALLAFLGIIVWQEPWPVAGVVHLMLAVGAMPLILAAMIYFTPVLTRSRSASRWINRLPLLALVAGGVGAVAVFQGRWLVGVAVPMTVPIVALVLGWTIHRARRALGAPHPGLIWYQAALVGLMLGLLAMLASLVWPEQWLLLRTIHRHFNLLGFVGLTAVGTLQVLLPTVGDYADPMAGQRLRLDLKYAVLGVLWMTGGATVWPGLSWLGLGAWSWVVAGVVRPLRGDSLRQMVHTNGAALSLLCALLGFWLVLGSALWQDGSVALPLFFSLFLFPLVTGALAHLLPIWWWPGLPTPQRQQAQYRLGRFALLRIGTCWLGGAGMMMGASWGGGLAGAPVLWFLAQVGWLLREQAAASVGRSSS